MRTDKPLLGLLACVLVAVGSARSAAEEPAAAEETVKVVVSLPDGRKVVLEEKAQPSRNDAGTGSATVDRVLPDGSRVRYGAADAPRQSKRNAKGKPAPSNTNRAGSGSSAGPRVSTLGAPTYRDGGATGGQDVRFFDAGISAMVVGRTVYIWGAELIQSSAEFEVIEGEKFSFDGVVARQERPAGSGDQLTGGDTLFAPIKLKYEPDTQVDLVLHARAENPNEPDRAIRTWTFRVR